MKRIIFSLLILFPSFCWSQTLIGVKAGYSPLSAISFKPNLKATPFYGQKPDFGLVIKHFDNKWFGFQGELNFAQRGFNLTFDDTSQLRQVNSYIELPIFMQIHFNLASVYVHVQAGCYAAYLLNAKQGTDTTGTMVLKNYEFNILRDKRFDYGLVGSAGLSREFKWGVIQVDVRILYGFGDLYKYTFEGMPIFQVMPEQSKAVVQSISFSYLYNISNLGKKKRNKVKINEMEQ